MFLSWSGWDNPCLAFSRRGFLGSSHPPGPQVGHLELLHMDQPVSSMVLEKRLMWWILCRTLSGWDVADSRYGKAQPGIRLRWWLLCIIAIQCLWEHRERQSFRKESPCIEFRNEIGVIRLYPGFTGESECCLGNILEMLLPPYSYSFLAYLGFLWCLPSQVQISNKSQTATISSAWSPCFCKEQQ